MKPKWATSVQKDIHDLADGVGNLLVDSFHYLALFAIGATIVWSAVATLVIRYGSHKFPSAAGDEAAIK